MALVELIMPKLGESIMEATILKWHKKPGDAVNEDDTVLDIATDKVDSEIPSPVKGVIEEILYQENDIVPIGKVIATIRVGEGIKIAQKDIPPSNEDKLYKEEPIEMEVPYYPPSESETFKKSFDNDTVRFYSPLVINIAQQEGISMAELENIVGTGQDGRVSKKDILTYVASKSNQLNLDNSNSSQNSNFIPEVNYLSKEEIISPASINYDSKANVEIIEMDRMRKLISHHMVESQNTSAHVTSFAECDVTNMVHWREKIKKDFESRIGEKITFTPLFIEAIVKSIKKYPLLSSSVVGDKIIIKKNLNIGMATSLPDGNLIVPVIKNADQLNLVGLTKQVNGLANAARSGKLRPDDTTDGTFTLTNIGTFGSIMGTPIINQPQVAIMAIGVIKKRPMVIETSHGDSIAIRHMMYVSLSYDHRIIDGSLGSTFLNEVVKELENFDINRNY
ncbi:MAG: 2-oxo acid dehydrogenase subunit E2 [Chitinophagia bacterium]|nr:2-oxo acid dehydrogenase subunit E2 [Chitinophagia bacterium]